MEGGIQMDADGGCDCEHGDPNLREGPSGPRCEWRAAHARRGSKSKAESEAKIAQGHSSSKVARTRTALTVAAKPIDGSKIENLAATEPSMTDVTIV